MLYDLGIKVFVKNLMFDYPIFDFVQINSLQFIDLPGCLFEKKSIFPSLFVGMSDFTECQSGDLNFLKSKSN